jgi:hypothetical protein
VAALALPSEAFPSKHAAADEAVTKPRERALDLLVIATAERLFTPPKFCPNFDLLSELLYDRCAAPIPTRSGTVVCGLYISWNGPLLIPSHTRRKKQFGRSRAFLRCFNNLSPFCRRLGTSRFRKIIEVDWRRKGNTGGTSERDRASRAHPHSTLFLGTFSRLGKNRSAKN